MDVALKVAGMTCQGCVRSVQKVLEAIPGVTQQSVNKSTTIQLSATANGLNLHEARWTDIGSPDAGDDSADGD